LLKIHFTTAAPLLEKFDDCPGESECAFELAGGIYHGNDDIKVRKLM
jgi:hypothetical protein